MTAELANALDCDDARNNPLWIDLALHQPAATRRRVHGPGTESLPASAPERRDRHHQLARATIANAWRDPPSDGYAKVGAKGDRAGQGRRSRARLASAREFTTQKLGRTALLDRSCGGADPAYRVDGQRCSRRSTTRCSLADTARLLLPTTTSSARRHPPVSCRSTTRSSHASSSWVPGADRHAITRN